MNTTKNRYRNPWHKSLNVPKPEFYENNAPQVLEHRGVKVFKLFEGAYDFVLGDCCITQRAGITEARREIDLILNGETFVDRNVAEHLKLHGYNARPYPG
jgi:hypothetical protein